jgi:uncharacterized protein YfiM (DUF2279 family)
MSAFRKPDRLRKIRLGVRSVFAIATRRSRHEAPIRTRASTWQRKQLVADLAGAATNHISVNL